MAELLMPSKVHDKNIIQTPDGNVVDSDDEWDRCGKWMLHHPRADLAFLDEAWTVLRHLLQDGTLIMLKATTARWAEVGASIYCYTRPGKREARRAATAIRALVRFDGIMYYKINKPASREGSGQPSGDWRESVYMSTFREGFYTKENGIWMQDEDDITENTAAVTSEFWDQKCSGNEKLPSTYKGQYFWELPENHQCKRNGLPWWRLLFCSCEDEEKSMTMLDRVWLVAKQLLEEGTFEGLSLVTKVEKAKIAELRLYVGQDCDVYSRLAACDRILQQASCRTVMYFSEKFGSCANTSINQNRIMYDYKYTSDGELYRRTKYSEEYVLM